MKNFSLLYHELRSILGHVRKDVSPVLDHFFEMEQSVFADGELSKKQKLLMAIAISLYAQCDECLTWHLKEAKELDINDAALNETMAVAIVMGGGPALMSACKLKKAWTQHKQDADEFSKDLY